MNRKTVVLMSAVIGALLAPPVVATDVMKPPGESALQMRLDAEEARLRPQRQALQGYFRQAYARCSLRRWSPPM